jgi:glutathione peroxidase
MNAHDFTFTGIGGEKLPLDRFKGKPVLVVNTASECGFTPQYAGLQKLWQRYKDRGLIVLGVPSNDFGGQEPGTEPEIAAFCTKNYGVDFPLTAKVDVVGAKAHPFYKWLASELGDAGQPRWNFHKYLIGPDGAIAGVFPSKVAPESLELGTAIEAALKA